MIKIKYILSILLIFISSLSAQSFDIPKLSLAGIPSQITISNIPDTLKTVELSIIGKSKLYNFNFNVVNGKISGNISIDISGNYVVKSNVLPIKQSS